MALHPEPTSVTAGDTVRWRKTIGSFAIDDLTTISPIADGYALTYAFRGSAGTFNISASVDGADYLVNELAAITAAWASGFYSWEAYLTKTTNRYLSDSGKLTVLPNLATAGATDGRTHARVMLDAIKAVLENRATSEISNYSYAGKSITKMSHRELVDAFNFWRLQIRHEEQAEGVAKGLDTGRNIFVRFAKV